MNKLDKTIRSVQNRINESRNRQGVAVTIALTTLSDIMDILNRTKQMREARDEPKPMKHDPLYQNYYCPSCGIRTFLWNPHKYCARCGQALEDDK
jgi:hypothetical protein